MVTVVAAWTGRIEETPYSPLPSTSLLARRIYQCRLAHGTHPWRYSNLLQDDIAFGGIQYLRSLV